MGPQVDPPIDIGTKRLYDASITNFLCCSVRSCHISIPKLWHWFGFISDFPTLLQNHKPCPKYIITTFPELSANSVTTVQIDI